ncbi:hypothetical protein A1O3_08925 [Capronia epimyces CBS 606.96]|uniref:SWR1-complex protein 3 domain-containing protein n=1 Tax=Capronia epimyces CBS 606.96 TaxID=1182542 RepID=W9XGT4_9EURO|nr:uncharacterized protein A1O3_08925 [Capronia epimyces CBS 606.96]EXJ79423.1 hypothetical protein A1O3_08925 [Capronia epimyces CBS 606.96]
MVDSTPQKRMLPARERRDGAAKRRVSSPGQNAASATPNTRKQSTPTQAAEPRQKRKYTKRASLVRVQTPASRSSPSTPAAEEALPTRLVANKPLPTLKNKQPSDLPLNDYQSIAESAVLSASLHRSRMQWLCEGIFQKYWVKPSKRKGVVEAPPNNPDVKSMQKLGSATITIEPHTFDAIFYTVRDPSTPQPYHRHANQHTTKNKIPPPPPYGVYHSPSPFHRPGPHVPTPPPTAHQAVGAQTIAPGPSSHTKAPLQPTPRQFSPVSQPPSSQPVSIQNDPSTASIKQEETRLPKTVPLRQSTSVAPTVSRTPSAVTSPLGPQPPGPSQRSSQPPGGKGSTTDPVIQMLAARAASDPQLKELMKIVATSKASAEQLKEFQAHIDEFNEVVKRQEAERIARSEERPRIGVPNPLGPAPLEGDKELKIEAAPTTPAQIPKPPPEPPAAPTSASIPAQAPPYQPPPSPAPGALPGVIHPFPHPQRPPVPVGPPGGFLGYPPPPRPEPVIKHIVLELTSTPSSSQSACQDRWLFPEHAVLEIRYGGLEMICSFLVERKGSEILSRQGVGSAEENSAVHMKWKEEQGYYQPVTMTVKAVHHRTIETIARAAKPLPVVQGYMKEIMEKQQRAPVEYLAYQLPRERSLAVIEPEATAFVDSGVELGSESCSEDDELKEVYVL